MNEAHSYCQICVEQTAFTISNEKMMFFDKTIPVYKVFVAITGVKVPNDKLIICLGCKSNLRRAYRLREKAKKSAELLSKVKEEITALPIEEFMVDGGDISNELEKSCKKMGEVIVKKCAKEKKTRRGRPPKQPGERKAKYIKSKPQTKYDPNERIPCEFCGKEYAIKILRKHIKRHFPERPFVCDIEGCTASFKQKYILVQHVKGVHEKQVLYECEICKNQFKGRGSLVAHMRLKHTKKNCLECKPCQKWYLNEKLYKLHFETVHLDSKNYICKICKISVSRSNILNRHYRRKHPEEAKKMLEDGTLVVMKTPKRTLFYLQDLKDYFKK